MYKPRLGEANLTSNSNIPSTNKNQEDLAFYPSQELCPAKVQLRPVP